LRKRKEGGDVKVWVGMEDFETAFAKVRPSVSTEQRRGYKLLASKFTVQGK